LGDEHGHRALSRAAGGAARARCRQARGAVDAHRLGQVARRARPPLRGALPRQALVLHRAGEGAREREVLRALRRVRARERRHADRRRQHQLGRADRVRDTGGARQHRAPPGHAHRRALRGDGRVPLLRRPRPRLGLAGAAARARAHHVPADVGHARQHRGDRGEARGADRPRRRARAPRRAPGAARLRVARDAAPRVGGSSASSATASRRRSATPASTRPSARS